MYYKTIIYVKQKIIYERSIIYDISIIFNYFSTIRITFLQSADNIKIKIKFLEIFECFKKLLKRYKINYIIIFIIIIHSIANTPDIYSNDL